MTNTINTPINIRYERTFSQEEFNLFADISGDDNPIHVDPEFSANSRFGRPVSHGMLLYTVIWGCIQRQFPGCTQLSQHLKFPAPTYTGETMEVVLTASQQGTSNKYDVRGEMLRKADGVITCEAESVIEIQGAAS